MHMRIGVYGTGVDVDSNDLVNKARKIGERLAEHGCEVVTGGCAGLPYEAARAAYEAGAKVVAFSPATCLEEHIKVYRYPSDVFSEIRFVPSDFPYREDPEICKKLRNVLSVAYVHAAIIISGRVGTLNEFTIAYDLGKPIGVLEGSGSITSRVIPVLLEDVKKETGAIVIFESDPEKLVDRILELSETYIKGDFPHLPR